VGGEVKPNLIGKRDSEGEKLRNCSGRAFDCRGGGGGLASVGTWGREEGRTISRNKGLVGGGGENE